MTTGVNDSLYPSAQWDAIVANAKNNGYKRFRIYGNDCGMYPFASTLGAQTDTFYLGTTFDSAAASAKKYGLPVLIGIWVGMFVLTGFAEFRLLMLKIRRNDCQLRFSCKS